MADELREAADLCCDENSEWWDVLTALVPRYIYGASDAFAKAIEAEIESEHTRLKREFKVIEEPFEQARPMVIRRLVHESEPEYDDAPDSA